MTAAVQPGRHCPLHYRYAAESLKRPADLVADTLYVVGGLYGNTPALRAIQDMAAAEPAPVTLVFNGDFNWFNIDPANFAALNHSVLEHHALRGNVETELAAEDDSAGCGCAYPESVSDAEVARSNAILARLRATARVYPELRATLAALPMTLTARVGSLHVAIVHGDCESLAGWAYDESALRDAAGIARAVAHCDASGARIIASSHTCLPVALALPACAGASLLFNNGAAGMPNFAGTAFGVITRIATTPTTSAAALYGATLDDVHVDALAVHYDQAVWLTGFSSNWPEESAAALSYGSRIHNGPRYGLNRAMGPGVRVNHQLLRGLRAAGSKA